uniref:Uncharacterized protein n=1 Tax=Glossina austeni TaxID=7395 RepID=A0A1A9UZY1_GLOAU
MSRIQLWKPRPSTSLSAKIVRDPAVEKMEPALSLCIEDRNQKRVPRSGPMIREKSNRLYAEFTEPDGSCSGEGTDGGFEASEGCFNKFKVRQSLHNIKIVGEAASADTAASERYPEEFANLVADGGYKPQQPALTAENDEDSVQVQTLTANLAEIAHGIGRDGFEQTESIDIQEFLESQDEDLTETDLGEMLISQPIEEEASTSTGNVTFNLKSLSEGTYPLKSHINYYSVFTVSVFAAYLWNVYAANKELLLSSLVNKNEVVLDAWIARRATTRTQQQDKENSPQLRGHMICI